jgi:hypothetical protein
MILDAANAVIVEFNFDAGNFTGQIEFVDVAMSGRVTSGRTAARFFDGGLYGEGECVLSKPTGKPL